MQNPWKKNLLMIFSTPVLILLLGTGVPVEFKDNPQSVIIRKCLSTISTADNAHILIDGFYHEAPNNKVSFHFDGVIDFPGNMDGALKISGGKINREGHVILLDGKTFFQNSGNDKWKRLETNNLNEYEQQPLFMCMNLLLTLTYYPDLLKNKLHHSDQILNEVKTDYFKFDIDLAKLRTTASKPDQIEKLQYFSEDLTGTKATAEIWIEKGTKYLLKFAVDIDGWGKSKKPLSGSIILSDYNSSVTISSPKQFE